MDGYCFRLVSRNFYNKLRQSAEPEMVVSPLDNITLKAKHLDFGTPEQILGKLIAPKLLYFVRKIELTRFVYKKIPLAVAMDRPKLGEIHQSIVRLKESGALLRTKNGKFEDRDGDLTFIGRLMSSLPIDLRSSKLIILGYCFGIMTECIIIAAALNCRKSLFRMEQTAGVLQYDKLLEWADGSGSDLYAMLNACRFLNLCI